MKVSDILATLIAQIACHENQLPQDSPCSPVIADLIAHLLDVRLVQLAQKYRVTYSRYADDISFSTKQRSFPSEVAYRNELALSSWELSEKVIRAVSTSGFSINPDKTRMQFCSNRQLVTGLTVNRKVNIRREYYRSARAMCNSLFRNGHFHKGARLVESDLTRSMKSSLRIIEGVLGHIYYIKNSIIRNARKDKEQAESGIRKLYSRLIFFQAYCQR